MNYTEQTRPGALLLITVLLVGATALTISLNVALRGINELDMGFASNQSQEALAIADGCAQEALLQVSRNSSYTGTTLVIADGLCSIAVNTNGNRRTVDISAIVDRWVRNIVLELELSGSNVSLLEWRED